MALVRLRAIEVGRGPIFVGEGLFGIFPVIDPKATKRALRRRIIARLAAIDPSDRQRQEAALGAILETLDGFDRAGTVLLYASGFPEEVATAPWIDRAHRLDKRVVLPRVDPALNRLRLFAVDDPARDLVPGFRQVPEPGPSCLEVEPSAIEWALIPGLGFDRRGYRLGRGAGHYDRLLPTLRHWAPTWALILDAQWVAEVPTEPHDRPLRGVADHRGLYRFDPDQRPAL